MPTKLTKELQKGDRVIPYEGCAEYEIDTVTSVEIEPLPCVVARVNVEHTGRRFFYAGINAVQTIASGGYEPARPSGN